MGAWVFKVHGSGTQMKGVPDLIACLRGRFVAVEMKQPGKIVEPDDLQEYQLRLIKRAGGVAGEAHSLEEVLKLLEDNHVCAYLPDMQFVVSPARLQMCLNLLKDARDKLDDNQAIAVYAEIGLGDRITYSEDGSKMIMNVSDLQVVAAAAAISAAIEAGAQQVLKA